MPKRKYLILISSVLILVALFLFNTYRTKNIYSFINIDKITSITIQSGITGDDMEGIDEKAVIEYFKNVKFKKQFLQPPSGGWSYNVTFKTNSKEFKINFVSDTFVRINGKRYTLLNNNSYKLKDILGR